MCERILHCTLRSAIRGHLRHSPRFRQTSALACSEVKRLQYKWTFSQTGSGYFCLTKTRRILNTYLRVSYWLWKSLMLIKPCLCDGRLKTNQSTQTFVLEKKRMDTHTYRNVDLSGFILRYVWISGRNIIFISAATVEIKSAFKHPLPALQSLGDWEPMKKK